MSDFNGCLAKVMGISSEVISKNLSISHFEIIKKIDSISNSISSDRFNKMYSKSYRHVKGRDFKIYNMSRSGYMFLLMNTATKKIHKQKLDFIDTYYAMENNLLLTSDYGGDIEWVRAKSQSDYAKLKSNKTISVFVEYAKRQGFEIDEVIYYERYPILRFAQKRMDNIRKMLTEMDLQQLCMAEVIADKAIMKHIKKGEHYKVILILVEQEIRSFYSSLILTDHKA